MKNLQEIKNEVSKEFGFVRWSEMFNTVEILNKMVDKVAKKYAEEVIKECAEKAKLIDVSGKAKVGNKFEVDKNSILQIITELK